MKYIKSERVKTRRNNNQPQGNTISIHGDGEFTSRAVSAAFMHMFNAEAMKFIRIRNLTERLRQSRALGA